MQINCLHPLTILNPSLLDIVQHAELFFDGLDFRIFTNDMRFRILNGDSPYKVLSVLPFSRDSAPPALFFVDGDGLTHEMFVQVPCGHCTACLKSKHFSLVQRAEMAFQESKTPCYFVTLTYSPRWNYFIRQGVQLRHVQLFKKRFKRNIELFTHGSAESVKFLITSEYGEKNGRPHYHALIFGVPFLDRNPIRHRYLFQQMVNYCWRSSERNSDGTYFSFSQYFKKYPHIYRRQDDYDKLSYGFIQVSEILGDSKSCAAYACKYATKSFSNVPNGKNKLFRSVSHNLGFQFVLSHRDDILKDAHSSFKYVDWRSNKLIETFLSRYFVGKVFPSRSKLVPCDFRKLLRDTEFKIGHILAHQNIVSKDVLAACLMYKHYCLSHFPQWNYFNVEPCLDTSRDYKFLNILDDYLISIRNAFPLLNNMVDFDFDGVDSLVSDRERFLSKFKDRSFVEIFVNSRRWHREVKSLCSKAIL